MRPFYFLMLLLSSYFSYGQPDSAPYVVLVSFDGFRYDYVQRFNPPHFKKFIQEGSCAKGLIPSFPSKTFPNHYTLVTGLYPGNHGLVDNHFYDPETRKQYSMKDKAIAVDPKYYGGTPLWQLATQQGMRTASYFWVGSEVEIQHTLPDYYLKYDESVPDPTRVEQTIAWLQLPEKERPHFISLYFSFTDTQGHNTGTHSKELEQAVMKADSLLGILTSRVARLKLPVNIILVSDHGMMELKQEETSYITLGKLFNIGDSSVVYANGGTQAHLYTNRVDSLYEILKGKEVEHHFKIYKRQDFPAQWHYQHDRSGDLLLVADPGYYIQPTTFAWKKNVLKNVFGAHGYDPYETKDMQGIFYAKGPNIKKGITLEPFDNIHVYPFIAKILGLKIPEIDGKFEVLESIYKK
jgi:predicted AlkP superfamily pyrophosphatase or phosphodiesterase